MNGKALYRNSIKLSTLLVFAGTALPAVAKDGFNLAAYVPADVFLFAEDRHNSERDFLDAYWGEVWDSLMSSGVCKDVMDIISTQIGEEQKAEADRLMNLATTLIEGVNWEDLDGGQSCFAMRMAKGVREGNNYSSGPPDMVWLIRGKPGSAAKNYDGLAAILDAIVAEINKAAGSEVTKIDRTTVGTAKVAALGTVERNPVMPGNFVAVAMHGETIVIGIGDKILGESLAMLGDSKTTGNLASTPRYKAALASLPAPEDSLVFFDMGTMLGSIRTMVQEGMSAMSGGLSSPSIARPGRTDEVDALNNKAMDAYGQKNYQLALDSVKQAHAIAPQDSLIMYNLACFNALSGNREEALSWLEKAVDGGFHEPEKIATDEDLVSLRADARFQTAMTKAGQGGSNGAEESDGDSAAILATINRVMDAPAMIDYIAEVYYTDGYSTRMESIAVLASDAKSKPFFPVVGGRPPLTGFEKYLPRETVSFSVGSGIDLNGLYTFVEDTIRGFGQPGEDVLNAWVGLQAQIGLDVRKDLLSWIQGETISVTIRQPSGDASVTMIRVSDETKAREQLTTGLELAAKKLGELSQQQPMLAMFAIRTSPATHEKLAGFQNVSFGMSPQPAVAGVMDGYLILGTSEDAVALCLATAKGEHPNVTKNAQLMAEAVLPKGPFCSISFTDQRQLGAELAVVVGTISMMGTFAQMAMPPEAQGPVGKIMGIIAKLSPVAQKINFFKSTATCSTFDGKLWRTQGVTHYVSPSEHSAGSATTAAGTAAAGSATAP